MLRAIAIVCLLGSVARAGEGESALSPSLGWATYATLDKDGKPASPDAGAMLGATYERGISEALSWRVSAVGGGFVGGGTPPTSCRTSRSRAARSCSAAGR